MKEKEEGKKVDRITLALAGVAALATAISQQPGIGFGVFMLIGANAITRWYYRKNI